MWYVYYLENKSEGYHYIGYTSELKRRLTEHNDGHSRSTKLELL